MVDNSNSDLSDDEESNLDEANVKEKILSVISNTIETKLDKMIDIKNCNSPKIQVWKIINLIYMFNTFCKKNKIFLNFIQRFSSFRYISIIF